MTGLDQVMSIVAQYGQEAKRRTQVSSCVHCRTWLQESVTGSRRTVDGHVCSDCYFDIWGKLVEKHPISSPRRR